MSPLFLFSEVEYDLRKHSSVIHKRFDEVQTFRRYDCSHSILFKYRLARHVGILKKIVHESSHGVQMYACTECSYTTKLKHSLQLHMLRYEDFEDRPTFECAKCSFKTKKEMSF